MFVSLHSLNTPAWGDPDGYPESMLQELRDHEQIKLLFKLLRELLQPAKSTSQPWPVCRNGTQCPMKDQGCKFNHKVCAFHKKGTCKNGDSCGFVHEK